MSARTRQSTSRGARAVCVLLALGAPYIVAARDRNCHLWQVLDQDASKFTTVSGVLNDKYSLGLKGSWHPHISGKMLQSFSGRCPAKLSDLDGRAFELSTSESEPIHLTYSEVKAGPATIRVSELSAKMLPATFIISDDACTGALEGASFCFTGTASLVALDGNAHALGHDFDLTGATGTFTISGYVEPDELSLGLQLVEVSADFAVDTKDVHGPFKLGGHIAASAELPYTFNLGLRSETEPLSVRVTVRGAVARAVGGAAMAACLMALVAAVRARTAGGAGGAQQLLGSWARSGTAVDTPSDEEAAAQQDSGAVHAGVPLDGAAGAVAAGEGATVPAPAPSAAKVAAEAESSVAML